MAIEKVRAYFETFGRADDILEFPVSSATVALAAQALGTEEKRIAKTMSFKHGDGCILVVAAGDARVDNKKFRAAFGMKASMLHVEDVERIVGHDVGGVCPFAVNDGVNVYLDESLKRCATVFPACGSANSAIELTCEELEKFGNSKGWVDVCRGWEEEE